jgi:hypothetical protein
MVERRKKLACFQKTRSGVIKKGDTTKASVPVNSPFTLEDLVHIIDVSVNSNHGVDLEGMTRTLRDSMQGSVESLRQEFKQEHENLLRQIRTTAQQVLGEAREKQGTDSPDTSAAVIDLSTGSTQGAPVNPSIATSGRGGVNLNLQQPYYQAHAYGPGAPQLVPDASFPRPPIFPMVTGNAHTGMSDNVREQVIRALREFGLEPKGWIRTY